MTSNSPRVSVRCVSEEGRVSISFTYPKANAPTGKDVVRVFNFSRSLEETLSKTLERIGINVLEKCFPKSKKKKPKQKGPPESENPENQTEEPVLNALLLSPEGQSVSGEAANKDAWQDGSILVIGDHRFTVARNAPSVNKLALDKYLVAECPVSPIMEIEFCYPDNCKRQWFMRDKDSDPWTLESEENIFQPRETDAGRQLKVVVTPVVDGKVGDAKEATVDNILPSPGRCPFEKRQQHTKTLLKSPKLRFMTYNILAEAYADSDYSREVLYPWCEEKYLSLDYRKQLLYKEILGYNSDIICLQECDSKLFEPCLRSVLANQGLGGDFTRKGGRLSEGLATFFRKSRFSLVESCHAVLSDELCKNPSNQDILEKLQTNTEVFERISGRSASLQISVLQCLSNSNRLVCVGNTHFYFHPHAAHVRLVQSIISMRCIERLVSSYKAKGFDVSVIFAGDFNCLEFAGTATFIKSGSISEKHVDWYQGGRVHYIPGLSFSHPFRFEEACIFPYTNYVGYNAQLDHIFIEKGRFTVDNVVPMPAHEEVMELTALPNKVFPSDHLALICDLLWNEPAK